MKVILSQEEMLSAVLVGARRLIVSQRNGLATTANHVRNWDDEVEGAMAEVAVAKATNQYFDPGLGKYKAKDVGSYHIRQTALPNGSLIIRDDDPMGLYLLVVGSIGTYRIIGTCLVTEENRPGMKAAYTKAPAGREPAIFYPQFMLEPFNQ